MWEAAGNLCSKDLGNASSVIRRRSQDGDNRISPPASLLFMLNPSIAPNKLIYFPNYVNYAMRCTATLWT